MLHTEYNGKRFNELYKDTLFVKLTNSNECHNGFQFRDGLNSDTVEFDPTGECSPGGLYFCEQSKIMKWIDYDGQMFYIRHVIIPDDARVYIEENKFKADRIILGTRKLIFDDKFFRMRLNPRSQFTSEADSLFAMKNHKDYIDLIPLCSNFFPSVRLLLIQRMKEDGFSHSKVHRIICSYSKISKLDDDF